MAGRSLVTPNRQPLRHGDLDTILEPLDVWCGISIDRYLNGSVLVVLYDHVLNRA